MGRTVHVTIGGPGLDHLAPMAASPTDAVHPVSLRFRDADTEAEYHRASAKELVRPFRVIWSVAALLFASGVIIDLSTIPRGALVPVEIIRFATVGVFVAFVAFAFARPIAFERWWRIATATAITVVMFSMLAMAVVIARIRAPSADLVLLATLAAVFVIANVYTISGLDLVSVTAINWVATAGFAIAVAIFAPSARVAGYSLFWLLAANAGGMTGCYILERYRRLEFYSRKLLAAERAKSEALLLNILPASIAKRLQEDASVIADRFDEVTILFADIAGFTDLSQRLPPEGVVAMLNQMFTAFDELAEKHGLEKIKTIGDAYMVAGGLPEPRADHADAVAAMALDMRDAVARIGGDAHLDIRIGLNSGPAVAGVIGKRKFTYDLWGDAVNTASRMESHGMTGEIQVSEATYQRLSGKYVLEPRGPVAVKGKGEMSTWWLRGRA